ncbi:MAG: hypothetical protein ACJAS4_003103 [Bacteriovoracaceae bacterium]|jgi:hypothetical protein
MKIIIALLIFAQYSYAADICDFKQIKIKNTIIKTGSINNGEKCFVYITNSEYSSLVYRTHYFDTLGQYMIFNSFGDGSSSKQTGARMYSFLPIKNNLKINLNEDQLKIELAHGMSINFDLDTSYVSSSVGLEIIEERKITPNNLGGIEVNSSKAAFIDFGFKFGGAPIWDLNRTFQFFDKSLKLPCVKKNNQIFVKKNGEVKRKLPSNKDLVQFLRKGCGA